MSSIHFRIKPTFELGVYVVQRKLWGLIWWPVTYVTESERYRIAAHINEGTVYFTKET